MRRHSWAVGFVIFTAACVVVQAASDMCKREIYDEQCGFPGISEEACHTQHCCFNPATPSQASRCYWPINAEISAYHAVEVSRQQAAARGNGTISFVDNTCQWTVQLQPSNRTDGWGLGWLNLHTIEAMELATADAMQGYDVVIYGDSISENWRGTSGGLPYIRKDNTSSRPDPNFVAADMRAAFLETLGQRYRVGVMAIAGDHIGHLWWRLLNGQTPKVDPKVAVVLIGTNDLYAATQCAAQDEDQLKSAVKTIVTGFQQLLAAMRQGMPSTHIVVQALYPRGEDMEDNMFVWPSNFTYARNLLNANYQELTRSDPFMHYISCGEEFVTPTSDAIVKEYLPDGLHPNAEGLRLIAECLTPLLQKLTSSNATTNAIQPAQVTQGVHYLGGRLLPVAGK